MGRYIARRIAIMVPVFLGATLLIYGMVFLLPGDPIAASGGEVEWLELASTPWMRNR